MLGALGCALYIWSTRVPAAVESEEEAGGGNCALHQDQESPSAEDARSGTSTPLPDTAADHRGGLYPDLVFSTSS